MTCRKYVTICVWSLQTIRSISNSQIIDTYKLIKSWLLIHNLEVNNKKTKIIQFKPYQKKKVNLNNITNNLKIEVGEFKLLGITLDS